MALAPSSVHVTPDRPCIFSGGAVAGAPRTLWPGRNRYRPFEEKKALDIDVKIEEVLAEAGLATSVGGVSDSRSLKAAPRGDGEKKKLQDGEVAVDAELEGVASWATDAVSTLRIVLLVFIWWGAAICVVMVIKVTVKSRDPNVEAPFPYPFALTACSNTLCGIFSWLCSFAMRRTGKESMLPTLRRDEILKLFAIGLIQGVEIGCTNKVLEYLSMSGRTMLNSMNIIFMMATALCWRLERLGFLRVVSVGLLTCGGVLQGIGSQKSGGSGDAIDVYSSTHTQGMLLALFTMVIGSQRWALMQFVMQYSEPGSALGKMSKLRFMSFIMPVTGCVCLVLSLISESLEAKRILRPGVALSVLQIAIGVVALSFAELKLVHLTSAVAMQVLGTIHQIPIVLAGVFVFHDRINIYGLLGFGLCIAGALFYVAARRSDAKVTMPASPNTTTKQGDEEEMLVGPSLYGLACAPAAVVSPQASASASLEGVAAAGTAAAEEVGVSRIAPVENVRGELPVAVQPVVGAADDPSGGTLPMKSSEHD